ncbi:MAG TPA: serine hydrolase [Candidatus Acidoferrales bacterium]|nr:serine hydrolase [Candidatus Acidoferrales bacterium]
MIRPWKFRVLPLVVVGLTLCFSVFAQSPGKIDISKMNPAGLLVDKYSYMSQPYSFYYFHHMDQLGLRMDWIRQGGGVYTLTEPTKDFVLQYNFHGRQYSLQDYFERNFVTGFLVLRGNRIVVERYFHGADRNSRFVSQSISKSIISILIGAAVGDGMIKGVDDHVTTYLPYLSGGGYRDVTVKNLLQMSTGVNYSEDYQDPKSGAALIGAALLTGKPSFKSFAESIQPTTTRPGTKFEYQSVNSQVLGLLLEKVTGKRLNEYTQEKLWKKIGAQSDAFFYESEKQPDTCAFACFNATARDYARVGLMMLQGGALVGKRVISTQWMHDSTTPDAPYLKPRTGGPEGGYGYAYQWWIPPGNDGAFEAEGIYGQCIYVNPAKRVVIVQTGAWPEPVSSALAEEQETVLEQTAAEVAELKARR